MFTCALVDSGPATAAVGLPARRPRPLLVEDQPASAQSLHHLFGPDHEVFIATGGEQALEVRASEQPDLVLLDVLRPDTDGHDFCRRLKADAATRDIPVIFVSAQSDAADEALGFELDAVDFISRPINPNLVRARVKLHLALKAQSDLLRQLAYIDGLTGLHNRFYFDWKLQSECGRAARNRCAPSVVMLDVDHFKRYNDRYGHPAGDEWRRRAANVRDGLGRSDLANSPGEALCTLPFPRKNRHQTRHFVGI